MPGYVCLTFLMFLSSYVGIIAVLLGAWIYVFDILGGSLFYFFMSLQHLLFSFIALVSITVCGN
jgi:hypothetical protein